MVEASCLGAILLYSTTPEGCQEAVLAHVRARTQDREIVRLLVLQTPLDSPRLDEVEQLRDQFSGHGMTVQAADAGLQTREDAVRVDVLEAIARADVILATGGDPERMVRVLTDTPALDALGKAHHRGAILGGGSAGAMAYGAGYLGGTRDDRRPVALLGWLPNVVVAPHFGMYAIEPWRQAWTGSSILGLRDGAVVLVTSDAFTSLGHVPAVSLDPPSGVTLLGDFVQEVR